MHVTFFKIAAGLALCLALLFALAAVGGYAYQKLEDRRSDQVAERESREQLRLAEAEVREMFRRARESEPR